MVRRRVIVFDCHSSIDKNHCKCKEQTEVNENGQPRRTPAKKELSERPQGCEKDGSKNTDDGKDGNKTRSLLAIARIRRSPLHVGVRQRDENADRQCDSENCEQDVSFHGRGAKPPNDSSSATRRQDASIATTTLPPGSLQRIVRRHMWHMAQNNPRLKPSSPRSLGPRRMTPNKTTNRYDPPARNRRLTDSLSISQSCLTAIHRKTPGAA